MAEGIRLRPQDWEYISPVYLTPARDLGHEWGVGLSKLDEPAIIYGALTAKLPNQIYFVHEMLRRIEQNLWTIDLDRPLTAMLMFEQNLWTVDLDRPLTAMLMLESGRLQALKDQS